jgi:hypothetical protein
MTASFTKGLPAAIAGILGVIAAWAWFQGPVFGMGAGVLLVAVAAYGWLGRRRGKALLSGSNRDPVAAMPLLEQWRAFPLAGGALGAGVLVVLAVALAGLTPSGTPDEQKQLITAAFGVVTALITASLVKGLEDFTALVAEPIRDDFQASYKGCFKPGTNEWRAIYDPNFGGEEGWGSGTVRRARAVAVANKPCLSDSAPSQNGDPSTEPPPQ